MDSDNWIIGNLNNSLETWNNYLSQTWDLITKSPTEFRGGTIRTVMQDVYGALVKTTAKTAQATSQSHAASGAGGKNDRK